jgi:hypothetical protein
MIVVIEGHIATGGVVDKWYVDMFCYCRVIHKFVQIIKQAADSHDLSRIVESIFDRPVDQICKKAK